MKVLRDLFWLIFLAIAMAYMLVSTARMADVVWDNYKMREIMEIQAKNCEPLG